MVRASFTDEKFVCVSAIALYGSSRVYLQLNAWTLISRQHGMVYVYSPNVAESSSFKVEDGDVIILGTDGLFDNLSEDMILGYLSCNLKVGTGMRNKRRMELGPLNSGILFLKE